MDLGYHVSHSSFPHYMNLAYINTHFDFPLILYTLFGESFPRNSWCDMKKSKPENGSPKRHRVILRRKSCAIPIWNYSSKISWTWTIKFNFQGLIKSLKVQLRKKKIKYLILCWTWCNMNCFFYFFRKIDILLFKESLLKINEIFIILD